jgi:hypothetical protein
MHCVSAVAVFLPIFITHIMWKEERYFWDKNQLAAWHTGSSISIAAGLAWFTVTTAMGHLGKALP